MCVCVCVCVTLVIALGRDARREEDLLCSTAAIGRNAQGPERRATPRKSTSGLVSIKPIAHYRCTAAY